MKNDARIISIKVQLKIIMKKRVFSHLTIIQNLSSFINLKNVQKKGKFLFWHSSVLRIISS